MKDPVSFNTLIEYTLILAVKSDRRLFYATRSVACCFNFIVLLP